MAFFEVLVDELASFALTDEIIDGDAAVVLFHTEVGSRSAQGLNVVGMLPSGAAWARRRVSSTCRTCSALVVL